MASGLLRLSRRIGVHACALGLAACADVADPIAAVDGAEPVRGGTLALAMTADVRSLDPAEIASALDASVAANIYAGLVDVTADGRIVPVLAERVDEDPGASCVRVRLRSGLRFHDGSAVDAASVAISLRRALAPEAPSGSIGLLERIRGAARFRAGASATLDGLVVEGPLSLRIDLEAYDAAFVPSLTQLAARPVCPSARPVGDPRFEPCGAGPFRLEADGWRRGESITLTRFDGWFRAPYPLLGAVRWRLQSSSRTQEILFARGDLHVARDLTSHTARRLLRSPAWGALREREPATSFWGEGMNAEIAPFDNVEVRRAVAAAIDRRAIVALDPLRLRAGTGPLPPGAAGFDPTLDCQRFDRAAALEHMRRAGYAYDPESRTGGLPAEVPYVAAARTFAERSAQVLQAQLASIGIRIAPRLVSYTAYLAATHRRGAVAMAPTGWSQDYPDPSNFFDALYHRRAIADHDGSNTSFYGSAHLDEVLDGAHRIAGRDERGARFAEASRIVCDDAPIAFTHVPEAVVFRQPFVRGFVAHPVWLQDLERAWLAPRRSPPSAPRVLPERTERVP
jgi:peptide/nickel transport system substrate-binding protein